MQITPPSPLRLSFDVDLARERSGDETRYHWKVRRRRWVRPALLCLFFGLGVFLAFVVSRSSRVPGEGQDVVEEAAVTTVVESGPSLLEAQDALQRRQHSMAVDQAYRVLELGLDSASQAGMAQERLAISGAPSTPTPTPSLPVNGALGQTPPTLGVTEPSSTTTSDTGQPTSTEERRARRNRRDRHDRQERAEPPAVVQPPVDVRVRVTPLLDIEQIDPYAP